ncbi:DsrE/DsrF/DrsH-like family protein [Halegenticoccus tardaugens]|uniref:DsrE/DsrF/DrsH-like family protein n=1 Tax=Halegenticoccus tardaugens TaxID=2071624 RepID=UPI00100BA305|nr:DsrE/DsrF/DrsH-like family protein [Halegenticoccus tardaugens]
MSADARPVGTDDEDAGDGVESNDVAVLRERVADLEARLADARAEGGDGGRKMTIVATKGTLDMAYPPLILASTAAAFGWDVVVFHTFWGLDILREGKSTNLRLSAVGNPNLPMPNALAALPGMDGVATRLMKRKIEENGTATVAELIDVSLESGVDLQACQMTMDLMGYEAEDLHDGVTTGVGAATALEHMADADVQLLI